jgi:integrase
VDALVPREDRDLDAPVLPWLRQANLRREIARGCKATGTPLWSPHDLRHRRISLWHRAGVSWAQIGEWAGQRDLATTANVYSHVVLGREIDCAPRLPSAVSVMPR